MSVFLMQARAKRQFTRLILPVLLGTIFSLPVAAQNVTLYTPYTQIAVPPGQSVSYAIDIINKGHSLVNVPLAIRGLPRGWTYTLKSGGWDVTRLAVLPNDRKTVNLDVQVPLQINKGVYHFSVSAGGLGNLPLTVTLSQQGTYKSEFSSQQPNLQGAANTTFTYTATLRNGTNADQVYALSAGAPPGWTATFKADYKQVSSVTVPANKSKDITIDINPPDGTQAGDYKIPLMASTGASSASLNVDLVVTGSYGLQVTTPSGLLSTKATAGGTKRIELAIKNTGSAMLKQVSLQATAPPNWEVTFDPEKVDVLPPGATSPVFAIIKPDKKTVTGDYVTTIEAKTAETSSKADFRITVETSVWSGWLGIMIILLAAGSVYYLFSKYGRR
jgi:uncharacterized membrane protein